MFLNKTIDESVLSGSRRTSEYISVAKDGDELVDYGR